VTDLLEEPTFTEIVRGGLALALALSLPFVVYYADPGGNTLETYRDALAAVIAFYFGASSTVRQTAT
jgi:hypothetical protein